MYGLIIKISAPLLMPFLILLVGRVPRERRWAFWAAYWGLLSDKPAESLKKLFAIVNDGDY